MQITRKRVLELLSYDQEGGAFRWAGGKNIGKVAGCISSQGFRRVVLDKKEYFAHNITWFLATGSWRKVRHINGNRDDNRFENLCLVIKGDGSALTLDRLTYLLKYDPEKGSFTWLNPMLLMLLLSVSFIRSERFKLSPLWKAGVLR